MIHHVSISARDPKHVADVLAEVIGGRSFPFPGSIPDSFIAVTGDEHGTLIEVYPADLTLRPGADDEQPAHAAREQRLPETVPFHALLSVPTDQETIERIGAREGWRTKLFGRGRPGHAAAFNVIEFWIENRLMIELVPEEMIGPYLNVVTIANLERASAQPVE